MEQVDPVVLETIRAHVRLHHNDKLRRYEATTVVRFERDLYEGVNKVLERLGGRWERSAQAHVFHPRLDVPAELDILLATGLMPEKNPFSFFETPPELADTLVSKLREPAYVLEPSAGRGALVRALQRAWDGVIVYAVEIEPYNQSCLHALYDGKPGVHVFDADFLMWGGKTATFDSCAMNPPFSVKGDKFFYVKHVWKAMEHLAPGGRLAFIAPSSYIDSRDKPVSLLRKHLESQWQEYELERLPHGAFAPSGTNVSTVIVAARRPAPYDYTVVPETASAAPVASKPKQRKRKKTTA